MTLHCRKLIFLSPVVSVANPSWLVLGVCLVCTCAGLLHAVSLCVQMCTTLTVSLWSPSPALLIISPLLLHTPRALGVGFDEDILFRAECSTAPFSAHCPVVGLHVISSTKRSFSDEGLVMHWTESSPTWYSWFLF